MNANPAHLIPSNDDQVKAVCEMLDAKVQGLVELRAQDLNSKNLEVGIERMFKLLAGLGVSQLMISATRNDVRRTLAGKF